MNFIADACIQHTGGIVRRHGPQTVRDYVQRNGITRAFSVLSRGYAVVPLNWQTITIDQ